MNDVAIFAVLMAIKDTFILRHFKNKQISFSYKNCRILLILKFENFETYLQIILIPEFLKKSKNKRNLYLNE